MSFSDYDLYDNKSVESLTKEFKRTQHEIKEAITRNNTQKYNMLFLYRQEIRRLIREKENAKDKDSRDSTDSSDDRYNHCSGY